MLNLTITDFVDGLGISNKVEERQLQPHVQAALTLDLVPLLGWEVLEAVGVLTVPALAAYVPETVVSEGSYVVRRELVYKCLVTTDAPPPIYTLWQYEPLLTLWTQYLRPYWLREAYARFLPGHGTEATKAGLVKPSDPQGTFVATTSADRAASVAAAQAQADAYRNRLTAFLAAETRAYKTSDLTGYDYGSAYAGGCATTSPRRSALRGINNAPRRAHSR